MKPDTSTVAVITGHHFLKAVEQQMVVEDIVAAVSNLAAQLSARLREKKNVAIDLLLTEAGLAIKEIAVHETSAQVVGAMIIADAAPTASTGATSK